jgi:hypothetical protein
VGKGLQRKSRCRSVIYELFASPAFLGSLGVLLASVKQIVAEFGVNLSRITVLLINRSPAFAEFFVLGELFMCLVEHILALAFKNGLRSRSGRYT